jgi:hypothetical protein
MTCSICNTPINNDDAVAQCARCRRRLLPSLAKACEDDSFDYALKLRTGEVFYFGGAAYGGGDFITIKGITNTHGDLPGRRYPNGETSCAPHFPRGLDIRVDDIVWCSDAPFDS